MLELDGFYKINVETDSQPGLIRDFFFFPGGNRDPALFQDHSGRARVQASPGGGGRSCIVMGEPLRERDLARSSSSLAPPIYWGGSARRRRKDRNSSIRRCRFCETKGIRSEQV